MKHQALINTAPKYIPVILLTLMLLAANTAHANRQEKYGRSFMFTRPLFDYLPLQEAGWHELIYKTAHAHGACLHVTPAYQQSRQRDAVNRYFAPFPLNNLLVAGDNTPDNLKCARTIRAEWLQLAPTYQGIFHFKPEQRQTGLIFGYHQDMHPYTTTPFFKDTYVSISAPLMQVTNKLAIEQCDVSGTSTHFPQTLAQAFANPSWCAAKVAPKTERTELGELRLRWGLYFLQEQYNQLSFYFGLSLPTSKEQNAAYWFDAVTGYNGHFGVNGGITCQFLLNRDPENCAVSFFFNLDDLLLVSNHQTRTFDLKDKPWSRFLLYNSNPANSCPQNNVPGVNILTRKVEAHPYNIADFSAGWRVRTKQCEIEIGYNLWGHGQEILKLYNEEKYETCCPAQWGIAGLLPGTTASKSTISQRIPDTYDTDTSGNPIFIPFKECDIDLLSAASSSSINHAAHAVVSFFGVGKRMDSVLSLGGFAEYPQRNSALATWGIWGKFGASF